MNSWISSFFEHRSKLLCLHVSTSSRIISRFSEGLLVPAQHILFHWWETGTQKLTFAQQAQAVFPTAWEKMKWKEWEVVSNEIEKQEVTGEEFLKGLAERRQRRTHGKRCLQRGEMDRLLWWSPSTPCTRALTGITGELTGHSSKKEHYNWDAIALRELIQQSDLPWGLFWG